MRVYVCECARARVGVCVCVGAGVCVCVDGGLRLMSTEQQLFFPSENVIKANPNQPALDGNNSRSSDRIARRAPQTSPRGNFQSVCRVSPARVAHRQTEPPSATNPYRTRASKRARKGHEDTRRW